MRNLQKPSYLYSSRSQELVVKATHTITALQKTSDLENGIAAHTTDWTRQTGTT